MRIILIVWVLACLLPLQVFAQTGYEVDSWEWDGFSWVLLSGPGYPDPYSPARLWASLPQDSSCTDTIQWIQWSISGTQWKWVVRAPGIYAANSITLMVMSDSDVVIDYEGFEPLQTVQISYALAVWPEPAPPDDPAWVLAEDLNSQDDTLYDSPELELGLMFKKWNMIEVKDSHALGDYSDDATVHFRTYGSCDESHPFSTVVEYRAPIALWGFTFRYWTSCRAEVWATVNNREIDPPLFQGPVGVGHNYWGVIPDWANDLEITFLWFAACGNLTITKAVVKKFRDGRWHFEFLADWLEVNVWQPRQGLELPTVGDSTGLIQNVYAVVDLEEWLADPRPMQDGYVIVDGECPDLPGYLIGTTPIEFDSLAGPDENPLSTTPLTGSLYRDGGTTLSVSELIWGDANGDGIVDLEDLVFLIGYLYKGGPAPDPLWTADCNCDGIVNLGDVVYLISYLYKGGPPPSC